MGLLFDSFWRAVAYCVHPRVMALSVLPLLLMAGLAAALHYFYWDSAVEFVRTTLQTTPWLDNVWQWLRGWGVNTDVPTLVAPLLLIVALTPIVVMLALLVIGFLMTPALVNLVATRRFASLERKKGGSFFLSLGWMLGSTALALVALLLSVPLWLIPPLVLLLPPVQKHLTLKLMPHLRFSRMPGGGFSAGAGGGDTFEGEYQRKDDERDRLDHKDDRRD